MTVDSSTYVGFRAGEVASDLNARLDDATSIGALARRDLDRYYTLLRLALAKIAPTLSEGEASLIVDALNGTITEPYTASLLWASIADAIDETEGDGLAGKWGIDGPALVERLRRLTPFEALAIADAVERWWRSSGAGTMEERLQAVGLLSKTDERMNEREEREEREER